MLRIKKLLRRTLNLRDDNAHICETYAMIKILNKLIGLGMPTMKTIV
ncbi:hypothetical protein [Candidatus Enterovibrio luxaltus]|uniref:Mobile element protein n=1 Tax=Candidatus Enterovibrio altilux TaxID=1927128 RepID=A0A291BBZ7_9GAMM|nr:Mobile element protein [Candidatus Enterovibrio luxaltus]